MEKEYEVLKNERKLIHACIKNVHKCVQLSAEETVGYFASMYKRLSSLKSRFDNVQLKIIEYNTRNRRGDQKLEVEEYQMMVGDLILIVSILRMQDNYNKVMGSCPTNNVKKNLKSVVSVKLPKISIPPFDGRIDKWFEFKSLF